MPIGISSSFLMHIRAFSFMVRPSCARPRLSHAPLTFSIRVPSFYLRYLQPRIAGPSHSRSSSRSARSRSVRPQLAASPPGACGSPHLLAAEFLVQPSLLAAASLVLMMRARPIGPYDGPVRRRRLDPPAVLSRHSSRGHSNQSDQSDDADGTTRT